MLRSLSSPSPCDRLARLRVLWDDLTPSFSSYPSCGWIAHARPAGVQRASQVPWLCSPCVPRPMTPTESPGPDLLGPFLLASGLTIPSPSAFYKLSRLHVASGRCGHPCGPQGSLCTLHMFRSMGCHSRLCACHLLHMRNTQYGWLVRPSRQRRCGPLSSQRGLSPRKQSQASFLAHRKPYVRSCFSVHLPWSQDEKPPRAGPQDGER